MRITVHMNSKSLKILCKRLIRYVCKVTIITNGVNSKQKKKNIIYTAVILIAQQDLNTVKLIFNNSV